MQEERFSESERIVESVRKSAANLLLIFKEKLEALQGNEEITNLFLRQGYDGKKCFEEARRFFGKSEVRYLAIDGTKFEEEKLDMFVFYTGAFGYGGLTKFHESGKINSEPPESDEDSISLSAAIPISEEYSYFVYGEKGEGGTEIDPSRLSTSLMRLAEYYLAYKAMFRDPEIKIVLMDRTISADIAHISWKLRECIERETTSLLGLDTKFGKVSKADLELGRMLLENEKLGIPVARSQFLEISAMNELLRKGERTISQIMQETHAQEKRLEKMEKITKGVFKESFVDSSTGLRLKEEMAQYWDRLLDLAKNLADHVFDSYEEKVHPLKILDSSGEERWLTCEDIDYLSLILIGAIIKECWKRHALLVGIAKDSGANEFVRAVIPVLADSGLVKTKRFVNFESDTMLLHANSIANASALSCPWRTFEYDVCFRTISPRGSGNAVGECNVEGAYNNVIASERLFVKAYFQLWSSETNPSLRSHVFLYDRPCYPEYENDVEIKMKNLDNKIEEVVVPAIHYLRDAPISELLLGILDSMGREAIPEALGHNYALFLADKRAKVAEDEASRSALAAVELEIIKSRLDQQVLPPGKYRDYRSRIESARKKTRPKIS